MGQCGKFLRIFSLTKGLLRETFVSLCEKKEGKENKNSQRLRFYTGNKVFLRGAINNISLRLKITIAYIYAGSKVRNAVCGHNSPGKKHF